MYNIPKVIITNKNYLESNINYDSSNSDDINDDCESKDETSFKVANKTEIVPNTNQKTNFENIKPQEENELTQFIKANLFRRCKIMTNKFIHELVLECLDHLQVKDEKSKSNKYQDVTTFLNKTINSRRNYLKHQIVRVMQGNYL